MTEPSPFEFSPSDLKYIELDMLYTLLSDEAPYPWDPTAPDADHYCDALSSPADTCDSLDDGESHEGGEFQEDSESQWLRLLR